MVVSALGSIFDFHHDFAFSRGLSEAQSPLLYAIGKPCMGRCSFLRWCKTDLDGSLNPLQGRYQYHVRLGPRHSSKDQTVHKTVRDNTSFKLLPGYECVA